MRLIRSRSHFWPNLTFLIRPFFDFSCCNFYGKLSRWPSFVLFSAEKYLFWNLTPFQVNKTQFFSPQFTSQWRCTAIRLLWFDLSILQFKCFVCILSGLFYINFIFSLLPCTRHTQDPPIFMELGYSLCVIGIAVDLVGTIFKGHYNVRNCMWPHSICIVHHCMTSN